MNGLSAGEEDSLGTPDEVCCLVDDGFRCHRPAGNASYSKRIQKTVTQRKLKLRLDIVARHIYICDYHKSVIQSARLRKKQPRDSDEESMEVDTDVPDVNFQQLQVTTLRKYKKFFKISTKPGLNKAQLSETLLRHFKTIQVNDREVLPYFIYTVKTNTNRLDPQGSNI